MPTTVDPTWGVPVVCLIIAIIGVTWAKLYARAHERRYGPDPNAVTPRQTGPSSRR